MTADAERSGGEERLTGFDSLRCYMILCVIMLHAAMTYMAYVPRYWYVKDNGNSLLFTCLVVLLDSFPMTLLFFLAGFFAPPSLEKHGVRRFALGKIRRLGFPWIIGVAVVAPLFAHASYKAYALPSKSWLDFLWNDFLGAWYQQGVYWFLGTLLFFMLCYAHFHRFIRQGVGAKAILSAVFVCTVAGYAVCSIFLMPAGEWLNIGYVLYFQPARITGYAAMFVAGAFACKNDLFAGKWRPSLLFRGAVAITGAAAVVTTRLVILPEMENASIPASLLDALSYAIASTGITVFLVCLFSSSHPWLTRPVAWFTRQSFGIYWLHMIVLMPVLYALTFISLPSAIKFLAGCFVTLFVCYGLVCTVFKRLL